MEALALVLVLGGVSAGIACWYWSATARLRRALRRAKHVSIAEAPEDAVVRLGGRVVEGETLAAPLTGRRCVYYVAIVEEFEAAARPDTRSCSATRAISRTTGWTIGGGRRSVAVMIVRAMIAVTLVGACSGSDEEQILNPPRDEYETWVKIEPPGVVCGNNSQYKIFANFSAKSDNLVVVFEPGGACWDYDSCTGKNGIRGAANPNGITDDHWTLAPFISPFLSRFDETNPSRDWNMVYVPYCTGDVHTGNKVATYTSTDGPTVTFHHDGHAAVEQVVSWLDESFTHVPKMLVTGCSAGGVGSLVNYHFLRNGLHAVEKSYLLDDSGPVFPSSGYSGPLHAMIRSAWDLDSLQPLLPAGFTLEDMGTVNTALADEFPKDRLATTFFRRDYNFSLYSYERFYNFPPKEQILSMWDSDTQLLVQQYDTRDNLYYFIPYYRNVNDSHCTTVLSFEGSDIEERGMTLAQWVNDFVNDRPIESMIEAPVSGEDGTP